MPPSLKQQFLNRQYRKYVPNRNCPEEIIGEKSQPQSYTINDGLPMSANITVKVQEGLK